MDYIELTFSDLTKSKVDVLIATLAEQGFESFSETESSLMAYIPANNFSEELVNNLASENNKNSAAFEIKIIKSQNWNSIWENNFQPIIISETCCIRAAFHKAPTNVLYDIIIEPKMSFGTGHHETTALMIKHLLMLRVQNQTVLDMGCGTGVLAILASVMGAKTVTAVDIDELAYQNSIENIHKNAIENVYVYNADSNFLEGKTFNIILANINKNVLLADLQSYAKIIEQEGQVLMSGFFETDMEEIIEKCIPLKLRLKNKSASNNWALLHFIKT